MAGAPGRPLMLEVFGPDAGGFYVCIATEFIANYAFLVCGDRLRLAAPSDDKGRLG